MYTIEGDQGQGKIEVHEPAPGEEVADVPMKSGAGADTQVSSDRALPVKDGRKPKADASKAEILTKRRPYNLDKFVDARVKEIKALEQMMDEMEGEVREKMGKGKGKNKGAPKSELW